ncbi:glycosyltransferase family 4 protein [Paenibacillus sp. GCM10027628]|uniref:glycosyltransferase family 4 protein n=1 Tax=Paenibacillus sp. GCM10027628 TaxID=3273413 RepID=UPI0036356060
MKVLFIFYTPSGGMETLNRQRTKALQQHGIDCHLLYLEHGAGLQNIEGIRTYVMTDDISIGNLMQQEQYDALIVTSNYYLLPRLRQMGYSKTIIFEAQGLGTKDAVPYLLFNAIPYITNQANALLYPKTLHLMELFAKYYPAFPHFCFHNCIDSTTFTYQRHPTLPYPVVGWVGRADPNKNWQAMLDIFKQLVASYSGLKLWLFEDSYMGDEKEQYENALNQPELAGHVVRWSNVPNLQMRDYYSMIGDSGGFLLSTSVTEGFGYAMVEAMCCRCPVLSSDSDGNRSFLLPGITGMMYEQGDINQAVQAGNFLLMNPQPREALKTQARQHIEQHFSPDAYCRNFVSMLGQLGEF